MTHAAIHRIRRSRHTHVIVLVALGLGACAAPSATHPPASPMPPLRALELPAAADATQAREVRVLVDEPALKLASIVLRAGAVLPEHSSEVPVTIVALAGSGAVVSGGERLRLDAEHAVVLAAEVPHAVEGDPEEDLVLLVHHLGAGEERHR